jgi:hypothetical protein
MEERRRTPRHRVHSAMVLDDGAMFHAGVARDISEGGLYFETPAPLVVGSVVQVSPLERPGLEVRARIVRAGDDSGFGLVLDDGPERVARLLATVVGDRPRAARPIPRRPTIPPGQSGTS